MIVKDPCLLGLDFMKATSSILDLGKETLTIGEDTLPVSVIMTPGYQFSKVTVIRRTVVQPHSVSYIQAKLDQPIDGTYIVESCPSKHILSSRIYGEGQHVTLKVINDSDFFVTYKKGKMIGHAENAIRVKETDDMGSPESHLGAEQAHAYQAQDIQTERVNQDIPSHLQQMYLENISELSDDQKSKFKELIIEFSDVFSKDDFDLGCLNSGVEHKIQTYDEIPINEKFRRTPLQFQKQEQEYLEKLLKQGVIE